VAWGQTASDASAAAQQRVDWKKLIPAIREVLKDDSQPEEKNEGLYVRSEVDITGDGIPEALVNLGRGGAYTDYLAIMRLQNGRPVAAMFKEPNGKTLPLGFAEGASVRNTITVKLRPESHAVFVGEEQWLTHDLDQWFEERLLPVTRTIAERWGVLDAGALDRGTPLASIDGLIAATALDHDLTVVTRNLKDFAGLGVTVFNPWGA
jgi:hypothetical protein